MAVFRMPSLGADMEAGTLVEWLVKPGDVVSRGDIVAVVETQKGAIEIEIFDDGIVHELTADLGAEMPVGAPIAVILKEGEAPPAPDTAPAAAPEPVVAAEESVAEAAPIAPVVAGPSVPAAAPAPSPTPRPPAPAAAASAGFVASPAARTRAKDLGIDLARLTGSGPGGVIVMADVEAAAQEAGSQALSSPPAAPAAKPAAPATKSASPMEEMRKAIAAAMTRAKQTIPHFYLSETMDIQPAMDFLDRLNADRGPSERVLLGALFVRAAARAAAKVQTLNGHFLEGAFCPASVVNPGVAVALRGGGLVAPALMDALALDLDQTMAGMRDLVTRARAGRLRSSEMTEGTITISSLGDGGAEAMTGVIFPPQVALVGIGAPRLRPWVVGDGVMPRNVITLTMSADHRVSDGRQVARYIAEFETLIQNPEAL